MDPEQEQRARGESELLRVLGEARPGGESAPVLLERARRALGLARLRWRVGDGETVVAPPHASPRSLEPRALHADEQALARSPRVDPGRPVWVREVELALGEQRRARLDAAGRRAAPPDPGALEALARVLALLHELERESVRREREASLVALGRGSARLLHDLRHRVTCALAALRAGAGEEELAEELARLRALASAREAAPRAGEEPRVALADELASAVRTAGRAARRQGTVQVRLRCPRGLQVQVDPLLLGRLVTNLVQNAIEATPQGGEVRLAVRALGGEEIELLVQDRGPGLAPELVQRFETLAREGAHDEEGRALRGLGLASAHEAARALGARLTLESSPGLGTAIRVRLASGERAAPRTLLLVDDDAPRRAALAAHLRQCALAVLEAGDADEALDLLGRRGLRALLVARGAGGERLGELVQRAADAGLAVRVLASEASDAGLRARRIARDLGAD